MQLFLFGMIASSSLSFYTVRCRSGLSSAFTECIPAYPVLRDLVSPGHVYMQLSYSSATYVKCYVNQAGSFMYVFMHMYILNNWLCHGSSTPVVHF